MLAIWLELPDSFRWMRWCSKDASLWRTSAGRPGREKDGYFHTTLKSGQPITTHTATVDEWLDTFGSPLHWVGVCPIQSTGENFNFDREKAQRIL